VETRVEVSRVAAVFLREHRLSRANVEESYLYPYIVARALNGAECHGICAEFAPRCERNVIDRTRGRNTAVRVPANHVELLFEVQIVPQDLSDGLRGFCGIRRQGEEVWHGVARRCARVAADHHGNLRWLLLRLKGRGGQMDGEKANSNDPRD